MASALETLQQKANEIDAAIATLREFIQTNLQKIAAIDPKDPNALTQIEELRAEAIAAAATYNGTVQPIFAEMKVIANNTPDNERVEAVKIYEDAVTRNADLLKEAGTVKSARDAKKAEVQAVVDAKNKEVETNAAKTPEQTAEQNKQYAASGGAQDDKGGPTTTNSNVPIVDSSKSQTTNASPAAAPAVLDPPVVTIVGKSDTPAAKPNSKAPRLRKNPLGNFSSYTYQISLYMITPDAYNAFVLSGRKDINAFRSAIDKFNQKPAAAASSTFVQAPGERGRTGSPPATSSTQATKSGGVFLIAQSGGANSNIKRAPGFEEDFYIDDLKFSQAINAKATAASTNTTDISFTITEPYGFSFITKLRDASDKLKEMSNIKNVKDLKNPIKQYFILGIRFLGYDKYGELIQSADIPGSDGDPTANSFGLYERFFDIYISSMKFKIDGKAVIYNIEAANVSGQPFGIKRGVIPSNSTAIGGTVYDALLGGNPITSNSDSNQSTAESSRLAQKSVPPNSGNKIGLLSKLNADQRAMVGNSIEIANVYDVSFIGGAENTIKNARLTTPNDTNKLRSGRSPDATKTTKSNPASESKAVPDLNVKQFVFQNGTPIMQAIDTIITSSSYIEDGLKIVNKANEELELGQGGTSEIKWYNISAEIEVLGWDTKVGDFAYKTTYIIQPYDTPVVMSTYVNKTTRYYGPNKRYDYWYTGQNTEIISYTQQMDNTYFNVTLRADGSAASQGGDFDIPTTTGLPQNAVKTGGESGGQSLDAQNSYITNLFDPNSIAEAKITILGDPDYLMQTASSSITQLYNRFNGTDGFTINPNGGQVFIEINFKEPKGYFNKNGLLKINDSIFFWKYPAYVKKDIDARGGGVSYMLTKVVSKFVRGKFEQDLSATIATFADTAADTTQSSAETNRLNRQNNASIPTLADGVSIAANTPYISLPPSGPGSLDPGQLGLSGLLNSAGSINNVLDPMQKLAQNTTITIPTPNGPVQDGEAGTPTIFGRG